MSILLSCAGCVARSSDRQLHEHLQTLGLLQVGIEDFLVTAGLPLAIDGLRKRIRHLGRRVPFMTNSSRQPNRGTSTTTAVSVGLSAA